MKAIKLFLVLGLLATTTHAEKIILEGVSGAALTTGDLLDEADHIGRTTNVVELLGLKITARSGGPMQDVNTLTDSMGIDSDGGGDDSDAIEDGEKLILSFDQDVQINQFDFNQFSSGEVAIVTLVGTGTITIPHESQSNGNTDTLNTNLFVSANTEIEFYVSGSSSFGLDGIDVTVLGGKELELGLSISNGMALVSVQFNEVASTNYVLQKSLNLVSNNWQTISSTFISNQTWNVQTTNSSSYFRVVPD